MLLWRLKWSAVVGAVNFLTRSSKDKPKKHSCYGNRDIITQMQWYETYIMLLRSSCCKSMPFEPYAINKGAGQPAHPISLISAFVVRCLDSKIPILAKSKISKLKLVSVLEQSGLNLTCSQTPKTGFLVTGLIWLMSNAHLFLK